MIEHPEKKHPTIGCCGIDCGLCPRYYTKGSSRCPGCCGPGFFSKNPGCSHITCCVKKKHLEVCGECTEFPCGKFGKWFGEDAFDSFVTHKKAEYNLRFIRDQGLNEFLNQQRKRMQILQEMLDEFNEGRSKSLYCLATALLPIPALMKSLERAKQKIQMEGIRKDDLKGKANILKDILQDAAEKEHVKLLLRKPYKK